MYKKNKMTGQLKRYLMQICIMVVVPVVAIAHSAYAPIIIGDIMTFVPFSKVQFSLGEDKTLGQNEIQILKPNITNPEEVKSYRWIDNGSVVGTKSAFSTEDLSVGTHTLTLRITDIYGIVTEDTTVIVIQEYVQGKNFVGATKGEFSVNQGMTEYNLKIAVPPGVAGMSPKLSLHYSSGAGNGYMGLGWRLDGVSSITRCAQTEATDGISHKFGVKYNSQDRFCLDGQRLINIRGTYGANNTEYRTEINNYSKIVSRGSDRGGPKYFDVYTKSGLHYIYGASSSSYESRVGTPRISWKVDKITDSYGNAITFSYGKDTAQGIHYLKKVSYAGNSVEYHYENRKDPIKGYKNAKPYAINQRLKTIVVKIGSKEIRRYTIAYTNENDGHRRSKVASITESVEEGSLKPVKFTYSTKGALSFGHKSRWSSHFGSNSWPAKTYQKNIADVNGDGLEDIVGFGYDSIDVALGTGNGFASPKSWGRNFSYKNGWRIGKHIRSVIDMNADGLPDIVGFADVGVYVALNNGHGFDASKRWSNDFGSNVWDQSKYIRTLCDINGDGYPDIVGFGYDRVYVAYNKEGNGFGVKSAWINDFDYKDGWRVDKHDRFMVDVNGDGLSDIVGFADIGVHVSLNTGHGFETKVKWSNNFGANIWGDKSKYIRTMADVNGDGLPDIVGFGGSRGTYVALNTGYGFGAMRVWTDEFGSNRWSVKKHVRMLSDVNGDGLDDIVGFGDNVVYVALSNGHGFENKRVWANDFGYCLCWRVADNDRVLPDVDGDGLPDIVGFGSDGVYVAKNNQKTPLLRRATNSSDQDIHISYGKMIHNDALYYNYSLHGKRDAYAWNSIANDNIELSLPMDLVSSVSQIDGVGGYNRIRYKYFGYVVNRLRGSQGFHAIHTFDDTRKMNSGVMYKQIEHIGGVGFAYTGMPYLSYEAEGLSYATNKVLSQTRISYKDASKRSNVYEPYTYSNIEEIHDPVSKRHIQSVYRYNTMSSDGLGNIVKQVMRTEDKVHAKNFYTTTQNEYHAENTSSWHIGRLTKSTATHTQTDGNTVVRTSTFRYNSHGLLSEEVANAGTALALKKSYTYDNHGNRKTQRISGSHIMTAKTTFGYSSDGKFQTWVRDAMGLTTRRSYDARFGSVTAETTPDGVTTRWQYDSLGRKIRERRADGTTTAWLYKWYGAGTINSSYVHYVTQLNAGAPNSYSFYDSFGRLRSAYTTTLGGKRLYSTKKYYNKKAERIKEMLPYIQGEGSEKYAYTSYDNYGRPVTISKPGPDGNTQTTRTSYSNFTTTITNPKGVKKRVVKNAKEQVIESVDAYDTPLASKMRYSYDAIGQLLKTTDAKGNTVSMQYDAAGNKITMNDPDLGVWNYRYRADGKLYAQWSGSTTHSKHYTTIAYDIIGRVTSKKIYDNSTNSSSKSYTQDRYYYSRNGRLRKTISQTSHNNSSFHSIESIPSYDGYGRVIALTKRIDGKTFVSKTSYDAYGRVSSRVYPNGYAISHHYSYGILDSIRGSDGKVHYKVSKLNAFGNVSDALYGNGVRSVLNYNDAGYLTSIRAGKRYYTGDVSNIVYTYDSMGNVRTRYDYSVPGKQIKDSYSYDAMDRVIRNRMQTNLVHAVRTDTIYRYDTLGNMTYQSGIGNYSYYAGKPHAVKSAGNRSYSYDSAGNMTHRNGDTVTYNAMNMPIMLAGKNGKRVKFFYDTNKQRYLKQSNGVSVYYLGKSYEEEIQSNGTDIKQTCYISLGGKTIGEHVTILDNTYSINPSNPHYKHSYLRYFHTDALGSITAVTDATGKTVERRSYDAFGKIRAMAYTPPSTSLTSTVDQTTRAYTGHEQIKEIEGLIHMNARIYDSEIGRFLSADTVIQDPLDSQAYNRYSYVRNNPLKYTDPTGHSWLSKAWKKAKKWVKKHARTIASIAVAAVVTVVAPYLLPAMGELAGAAATGALAGAAAGAVQTKSLKGALKGALFGAIGAVAAVGVVNVTAKVFDIAKTAAHSTNFINSGVNKVTLFKAAAHGVARGAIQTLQGGSFKAGFMSGFSSGFDVGTSAMGGNTVGGFMARTVTMGVVGGTASALGGGKFSNGAMSGAFTHMFNSEARISGSFSGGVGAGGTVEKGISVAYDTSKPWYKSSSWSIQKFTTTSYGAYTDASGSAEISFGWSSGQNTSVVLGSGITGGSSVNTTVLPLNGSVGAEVFVSDSGSENLYNVSVGVDLPGGLPMENHAYRSETTAGW